MTIPSVCRVLRVVLAVLCAVCCLRCSGAPGPQWGAGRSAGAEIVRREIRPGGVQRAAALGDAAVILVGTSQMQMGIDLPTMQRYSRDTPVQLAISASPFMPVFENLANDPRITGTVIVSWVPIEGVRLFESPTVHGAYAPVDGDPQGIHAVTLAAGTERYFRLEIPAAPAALVQ